jgi:hypothetical protein
LKGLIYMAVTLSQAKLNVQDALQMGVIDEFRKSSYLLDNIPFDDCVSPTGGGSTLTYGYTRLVTQPTAEFRPINAEYTASEVQKQRYTVDLKVFGGKFGIDRVLANVGGIVDETTLQLQQKIKAASALFNDTVINGDSGLDANAFDGLDVALTGSDTEYNIGSMLDLSSAEAIDDNYKAFIDMLDEFLMELDDVPTFIAGNTALISKIRAIARRVGQYQTSQNEFGQNVTMYGGIPLVDLRSKPGTNDPVAPIAPDGTTSLYAARLALDGFHAISLAGGAPIRTWLPDFTTSGAVKEGEVEMVAAVALKATKAAGVFRNIRVK